MYVLVNLNSSSLFFLYFTELLSFNIVNSFFSSLVCVVFFIVFTVSITNVPLFAGLLVFIVVVFVPSDICTIMSPFSSASVSFVNVVSPITILHVSPNTLATSSLFIFIDFISTFALLSTVLVSPFSSTFFAYFASSSAISISFIPST